MPLMFCLYFLFRCISWQVLHLDITAVKARDVALRDSYQYLPVTEKLLRSSYFFPYAFYFELTNLSRNLCELVYSSIPSKISSGGSCRLIVSCAIILQLFLWTACRMCRNGPQSW